MKRVFAALSAVVLLSAAIPKGFALEVSAASAILVEAESGRILYEHNARQRRLIASTTKLMTALVAAQSGRDLQERVRIEPEWTGVEGSSIYLRPGEELTLENLLYGLLLQSGNDAAQAIAGHCGGVERFVERMNETAEQLGMKDSHFENPSGLDGAEHYSTAWDLAQLARAVLKDPQLAPIVASRSAAAGERSFTNHNKLLWKYDGCIGLKTGYTEKAGRTLVSAARRDGMTLICVTLNAPDDWNDHARLFDYGFANFKMCRLVAQGQRFGAIPTQGSLLPRCWAVSEQELFWCVGTQEDVQVLPQCGAEMLFAPVEANTLVGTIVCLVNGKKVGEVPLIVAHYVPKNAAGAGLFSRFAG